KPALFVDEPHPTADGELAPLGAEARRVHHLVPERDGADPPFHVRAPVGLEECCGTLELGAAWGVGAVDGLEMAWVDGPLAVEPHVGAGLGVGCHLLEIPE